MKTKFTPGPWRISNNIHGIDNVKCWGVEADIASHGIMPPGTPTFYTHTIANCGSTGKANANLIAAAPELLEALEIMLGVIGCNESDYPVYKSKADKARAAIRKAKGEL